MLSERCKDVTEKADSVSLLFYEGAGKESRLPFNGIYPLAILIFAVPRIATGRRDGILGAVTEFGYVIIQVFSLGDLLF